VTRAPDLVVDVPARLQAAFAAEADAERAVAMAAYMRGEFPFLGLPTPVQRRLARVALEGLPKPNEDQLLGVTAALWQFPEREYQYAACDYAIRHVRVCGAGFLDHVGALITTKSWWDTVDALAARVVGPLVSAHPALVATMRRWIGDDDIWLARTAILHQMHYGARTDAELLFGFCLRRGADRDFFIRKAIGWALREYSKTDAAGVRSFVDHHRAELSTLSSREALKWLGRRAAAAV
jgi:3-methyladenine DNA glycosylase AlkD